MVSLDGRLGLLLKKNMWPQPSDMARAGHGHGHILHGGTSTCSVSTTFKDAETTVVQLPGFRFHPTEEELVGYYLAHMVDGHHRKRILRTIRLINFYQFDPWELPAMAAVGETEWYFFCPWDPKYQKGRRANRLTFSGYWKATGAERQVKSSGDSRTTIGVKKTLVFYSGRAPNGTKSNWIMNEYRLVSAASASSSAMSASSSLVPAHMHALNQGPQAVHANCNSKKVAMLLTCNPRNAFAKAQRNAAFLHQSELTLCRVYKKPGTPGSHRPAPSSDAMAVECSSSFDHQSADDLACRQRHPAEDPEPSPFDIVHPQILEVGPGQKGRDSTTRSRAPCYQQPHVHVQLCSSLLDVSSSRPRQMNTRMSELPSELACLLGDIAARATSLHDQQQSSNAAPYSDSERISSGSFSGKNGSTLEFEFAAALVPPDPAAETVHPATPSEPWTRAQHHELNTNHVFEKGPPCMPPLDLSAAFHGQGENVMMNLPACTSELCPAAILSWLFEDSQ